MAGLRFKCLAGTALTLVGAVGAGSALADTTLGWYVSGGVGHTSMSSQSLSISDVTASGSANGTGSVSAVPVAAKSLKTDYDGRGFVAAGYRFNRNMRAELELGARPGKIVAGLGGPDKTRLGTLDKTSLMANLIYDVAPDWGVHPFIGVGVGAVQAKADYSQPATVNGHTMAYSIRSDKFTPAAQAIAGASLYVTSNLRFDLTYRYLRTGRVSYDVAVTDQQGSTSNSYTSHASGSLTDQSISVGLRWAFGYAPPLEVADSEIRSSDDVAGTPRPVAPVVAVAQTPPPVPAAKLAAAAGMTTVAAAAPAQDDAEAPAGDTLPWKDDPSAPTTPGVSHAPAHTGTVAAATPMQMTVTELPPTTTQADAPAKTLHGKSHRKAAAPAAPSTQMAVVDPAPTPVSATDTAGTDATDDVAASPVKATPWSAKKTRGLRRHRGHTKRLITAPMRQHYTVYFPLGGAKLTPVAQSVVADAAKSAQTQATSSVAVTGYADTSGAAAYNLSLSQRRAKAVATNLVANGVSETAISVAWKGETHLAVKTRNGVACAKNRRVTVNIRY